MTGGANNYSTGYGYGYQQSSQRVYSNYNPYITGQNYSPFAFGQNYSPYVNTQQYASVYNQYANGQNNTGQNNTGATNNTGNGYNTGLNSTQGWYSADAAKMNVSDSLITSLETKLGISKTTFDTSSNGSVSLQELITGLNGLGSGTQNGINLIKDTELQTLLAKSGVMRTESGVYYETGQMPINQALWNSFQTNLGIDAKTLDTDGNKNVTQSEIITKLNSLPAGSYNAQWAANDAQFTELLKKNGIQHDATTGAYIVSGTATSVGTGAGNSTGQTALVGDSSFFATKYNIDISSYDTQIQYGSVSRQELIAGLNTINPASANGQAMATDTQLSDFLKANNISRNNTDGKYYETGTLSLSQPLLNSVYTNLGINPNTLETDGVSGISQKELITKLNSFTAGTPNANFVQKDEAFKALLTQNNIQFDSASGTFGVTSGSVPTPVAQPALVGDSQFFATRYNITLSSYDTQVRDGVVSKQELIAGLNTINPASANGQSMATDAELNDFLKQNNITRSSSGVYSDTGKQTVNAALLTSVNNNLGVTAASLETDGVSGISQQELVTKLNSFAAGSPNANFAANDANFKNLLTQNGIQLDSATGQYGVASGLTNTNTTTTQNPSTAVATTKQNLLEALAGNIGVEFTGSNQASIETRMEGQVFAKDGKNGQKGPDISDNNGFVSDKEIAAYANSAASKSNAAAHEKLEAALLASGFKKENDLIVADTDHPVLGSAGGSVQKNGKGSGR